MHNSNNPELGLSWGINQAETVISAWGFEYKYKKTDLIGGYSLKITIGLQIKLTQTKYISSVNFVIRRDVGRGV